MRGPCASLLLRATLPESTGWNLRKFPRRLGQFPLSFPVDSRWVPALSARETQVLASPAGWSEVKAEEGEDGTLSTVET